MNYHVVKTKSSRFHEAYKTARNDVNRLVKNTKANYFQEVIGNSKNNSKEMWKNINQLIGKTSKTTNVAAIKVNEQIFMNKDDITETFNDYFSKIGTDLSSRIPPSNKRFEDFLDLHESAVFEFKSVSNYEVIAILNKLKDSSGQDKIPVKILKDSSDVCVVYLTYIFNYSLLTGIFPDDWKLARVSSVYKSGDKQECGNYRPISVNMDAGLINGILFLDLKKAFDMVDHQILIRKLDLCSIKNRGLVWFSSYLHGRTQVCTVNSTTSSLKYIPCGVPQGSNLGPLLFLIYINDLPNCLKNSKPAMYADDTNVSFTRQTSSDIEVKLNDELENVYNWLLVNKLTLNIEKTEYMIIGSYKRISNIQKEGEIKITIGDNDIKRVNANKSLEL